MGCPSSYRWEGILQRDGTNTRLKRDIVATWHRHSPMRPPMSRDTREITGKHAPTPPRPIGQPMRVAGAPVLFFYFSFLTSKIVYEILKIFTNSQNDLDFKYSNFQNWS